MVLIVLGQHIGGSPSPFLAAHSDCLDDLEELFGPGAGNIAYSSSTMEGEVDLYGVNNLRTWGAAAGWMTASAGEFVETVVVTFDGVVLLHHIKLMNWGAYKYQLLVRRCHVMGQCEEDVGDDEWVSLAATPAPTHVPSSQSWVVALSPEERESIGPVDSLRLDISGGSLTSFYSLRVLGFRLHGVLPPAGVEKPPLL